MRRVDDDHARQLQFVAKCRNKNNEQEDSFLALLVNLGIYGVAQAQEPTDTPVSHDDTIVVTAAEQNLQAPGVSTITADEIRKTQLPAMCRRSSVPCQALT